MNSSAQCHRIVTCRDPAKSFLIDGFCEDGGGGGSVAGNIAGLACRFLDELSSHVLIGALQFDFFRDRDTVLRDGRTRPSLVQHGVSPARTQRALDGPSELLNTREYLLTGVVVEHQHLRHAHTSVD